VASLLVLNTPTSRHLFVHVTIWP